MKNLFPILTDRLWYITAYFFVFMIAPFINILAGKLSKAAYKKLLIILLVLMSFVPTLVMTDLYVSHGYSAGWLVFMYLIGGYYKKFGFSVKYNIRKALVVLATSVYLIVISKYGLLFLRNLLHAHFGVGELIDTSVFSDYYNSPLVLINSILVFYLCISLSKINNKVIGNLILWISRMSLGIYIIHAHPFVLDCVLNTDNLSWIVSSNPLITMLCVFGAVIGVVLGSGVLEYIRMILFRLFRIENCLCGLGVRFDSLFKAE